uniref:Tudor domain containing 15 n=1 Tax=Myripristis murdjan TaxID=586833 RepID=A0A667YMW7_9TELE
MVTVKGNLILRCEDSSPSAPCGLWPVDLKLTHLDCNREATLIHFQGQYPTICDLDYNILQGVIQNTPKTKAVPDVGDFCLVEDLTSARWYRGRVQNRGENLFDVFLIDYGNVLSVDITHLSSCSSDLFILPPKIVCGFLANVLPLGDCWDSVLEKYLSSLIGKNVTGYIQAILPHKVLILEAPDINNNLVKLGFGRHVDTHTFLLLVQMLTEVPLKQTLEPVPDLLIEKPRGQEFFFKPCSVQPFEDIMSFCGPRLIAGTHAEVKVTTAVNPGLFFCQMAGMETALQAMSEKLARACESRTEDPCQKPPDNLGQLCSVKGKDEKWYRGFVQFLPVNSQVRVLFVDYGFCESVKVENIQRLPPDFHSPAIMAFPCSLSSLTDQDKAVKTQQLAFLKSGLLGRVLEVEISSYDEQQNLYSITVLSVKDGHKKDIGLKPIQELPKIKIEMALKTGQMAPQNSCYETLLAQAFAKTVQAEKVHMDSPVVGYVEYILNPSHFWIRTQKRSHNFEEMMEKIAVHFSQVKLDEEVLTDPELGTLCCAMYEKDMHFYRAVVIDILEHGAEVLFIDFGNIEKVPHMLIKKIPEKFASEPAFATCCTLCNVIPTNGVWTTTNTDFFRQAVSDRALLVHVAHLRKDRFVVDLQQMGNDNHSITELLVSSNHGEYCNIIPTEPMMQNKKNMNKRRDRHRPQCSVTVHSTLSGSKVQGEDWEATQVTTETLQEKDVEKIEIGKAQVPVGFRTISLKPGCEFGIRCSHISSPSDFWCQILNKVPALEELMGRIQQYYTMHTVPIQQGVSYCVARSPVDGRWYRACIKGRQNGHVEVILVDYGMTLQIKEHNLQTILAEHLEPEGQAFRCSLTNMIEPTDPKSYGNWNTNVCNSFSDFVQNSSVSLQCSVVSQVNVENKGLYNVVDLYDAETQQSITNMLVEKGLAREVKISTQLLSTVCPDSFIYSSFNLSAGKEEQVYISHVSSPGEVYCQLERNTDTIEDLQKKVSVESEKIMMTQDDTRAVVGKLCLAKYFDGKWYRGLACPVPSPQHLSVFFVDYGNASIFEKNNVIFIPRDSIDLLCTPMQAVRCSLAGVLKEDVYAEVNEWLDEAILNKQVRALVVGKNEDGSFVIELFDGDVPINEKVKELIVSLTPKPKIVMSVHTENTKKKQKTYMYTKNMKSPVKCFNSHAKRSSSLYPKSSKLKSSPVLTTCRKSNKTAKSCAPVETEKTRKGKQQMEHHDASTISEPSPQTHRRPCLPDKKVTAGFRAKCYVSYIDSVNSFFVQMKEDEPAILKMEEDITSGLCRGSLMKANPESLRVSDLVLAEYQQDGALYRSVVKGYEGNDCFKVEFVDYGNSAVVGKENIYLMTKECLSQPRFSIPCSLDTETDAFFTDSVMEKPLVVDFISNVTEKEGEACALSMSSSETKKTFASYSLKVPGKTSKSSLEMKRDHRAKVKPPIVQARDIENTTLLSVLQNGDFYVRLHKTTDLQTKLESLIADNIHQCEVVSEEDVKEGLRCLVKLRRDSQWHRAVVHSVDQGKCQVFLGDDGITEDISTGSLRRLCNDIGKIPNLAVLCRLNNLGFALGEGAQKFGLEGLRPMIGKDVKVVFVSYYKADNIWRVEIVMNGLFLIHNRMTNLQNHAEEMASLPSKRLTAGRETTSDASSTHQLFFAPVHMDKAYFGFAASVTTPFEFFVVLEDLLLIMNTVSMMLDDISGDMAPPLDAHLIPGSCCLLKSDTKKKWCRGEVTQADKMVVVNLVDYGHCVEMPYEDCFELKTLPEELRRLPKVTYPCSLRGVKPIPGEGQWTDEAVVFFQECLYQKNLQIYFREFVSDTHWEVDILADAFMVNLYSKNTSHL